MRRLPSYAVGLLLLTASIAAAQDAPPQLKIGGASIAAVGQEIRLPVVGLNSPDINTTAGLKPVIAWAGKLQAVLDAPPDASATVEPEIGLSLGTVGVKLTLTFVSDKAGVHVVVLSDGNTGKLATKRITVGPPVAPEPKPDTKPEPKPDPNRKVTAVTYVYEQRDGSVPRPVQAALNKLHGQGGVLASLFEDDSVTGTGSVPRQYQAALAAARTAGLPCLVVMSGEFVLRVVKAPTTEAQVLEAAK